MSIILKAENISKQYRLGLVGSGTLRDDIKRLWASVRGKEDPFLKVGEVNNRSSQGESDYVWALRDVNFEVKQGEVLGIIGKNGAGKSTLLKILSRVTAPTAGSIKTKGRIASLLEVGTGFHPELTGRENIYLNGAILGMTKPEITSKLDEIIDFSGCERYIDTPTKRYSSGMTVRLAFAVAAHLEPEILVVDEVLAVGDAEFQKKAIGKMQDISRGQGRTVLFVSHDMAAVKKLCTRALLLQDGTCIKTGDTKEIIDYYLNFATANSGGQFTLDAGENNFISGGFLSNNSIISNSFAFDDQIAIQLNVIKPHSPRAVLGLKISRSNESVVFYEENRLRSIENIEKIIIHLKKEILVPGTYNIDVLYHIPNERFLQKIEKCLTFTIVETGSGLEQYRGVDLGCVRLNNEWSFE